MSENTLNNTVVRQTAMRRATVETDIHWHTAVRALEQMLAKGDLSRFCIGDAERLEAIADRIREVVDARQTTQFAG